MPVVAVVAAGGSGARQSGHLDRRGHCVTTLGAIRCCWTAGKCTRFIMRTAVSFLNHFASFCLVPDGDALSALSRSLSRPKRRILRRVGNSGRRRHLAVVAFFRRCRGRHRVLDLCVSGGVCVATPANAYKGRFARTRSRASARSRCTPRRAQTLCSPAAWSSSSRTA